MVARTALAQHSSSALRPPAYAFPNVRQWRGGHLPPIVVRAGEWLEVSRLVPGAVGRETPETEIAIGRHTSGFVGVSDLARVGVERGPTGRGRFPAFARGLLSWSERGAGRRAFG